MEKSWNLAQISSRGTKKDLSIKYILKEKWETKIKLYFDYNLYTVKFLWDLRTNIYVLTYMYISSWL